MKFIEKFEEIAKSDSSRIFIVDKNGDRKVSYAAFADISKKVAGKLHSLNVKKGDRVLVHMDRCMEYVAATYGIWMVGAVVVPTILDYPKDRIDFIEKEAKAKYVIEDSFFLDINKFDAFEDLAGDKDEAVIYFTSGSTGTPKGIVHKVGNISDAALKHQIYFDGISDVVTASITPFSFGIYLLDFIYAMYHKETIHIISDEKRKDVNAINSYFAEHGITVCFISPQVLKKFKKKGTSFKRAITGSERVIDIYPDDYSVYVLYGSTEAKVGLTIFEVDKKYKNTPIGKPLDGYKEYILDDDGKELKDGETGELCIEGNFDSEYLNDEERTKNVFEKIENGNTLLHTGDLVYKNEDGNLVFVNRKDFMVKINGQRVEPYEIEKIISEVGAVGNAIIKAFEDDNNQTYLVAYYESKDDIKDELKKALDAKVPYYMVPRYFVRMDEIPKNANGKLDRVSLKAPDAALFKAEYVAPRNEIERTLCEAFEKVLKVDKVGIKDDFFTLGGDSIKVLSLIAEIKNKNINTNIVFNGKTPEGIAKNLLDYSEINIKHKDETYDEAPLNFSMQGVYLDSYENKNTVKYNITFSYKLDKDVNLAKFKESVNVVIKNHRVFDTVIKNDNGIIKATFCHLQSEPCESVKVIDLDKAISDFIKPFDVEKGPLYRSVIFDDGNDKYFVFDVHHLIFDGSSVKVFIDEILKVYNGQQIKKEELNVFDIAFDEKDIKCTKTYKKAQEYFRVKLEETDGCTKPVSDILIDTAVSDQCIILKNILDKKLVDDITSFTKVNKITENVFFTAAFAYALAKYNYSNNAVFTSASTGRHDKRLINSIGMFVKTIPLVFDIDDETSINDYLKSAEKLIFDTVDNDIISFADLAKAYDITNEVSFVYQSELLSTVNMIDVKETISDISVMVMKKDSYNISLTYRDTIFTKDLMSNLLNMYVNIIKEMIKVSKLSDISFVTDKDIEINKSFNNTEVSYDTNKTIIDLFAESVKKYPDKICLVSNGNKYTYKEIDTITDKLAKYIAKSGGTLEKVVGVLVDRNEYMLISALSALKAGCAYLPIDPTYPKERISFMIEDSGVFMLIHDENFAELISEDYKCSKLLTKDIMGLSDIDIKLTKAKPENLFSFVYTSGTTGKAKGVMIEHRNILCLIAYAVKRFELTENSKFTSYASFGFDANLLDMYPIISVGGELHIIPTEMRLDLNRIRDYFNDNGITDSVMTTQIGRQFALLDNIKTLKHIMFGGEKLVPLDPPKGFKIFNGYGPCEGTVFVSDFVVDKKYKDIPVGKSIDNVKSYIIDSKGRLLPAGASGELVFSGPHVTRGYLNRPEKNAEAYVKNTFENKVGYERLYKTGDVLRFLSDGTLQYIGRRDAQVKIRGFRIELTEVEEVIRRFEGIKDATVAAFDEVGGGKFLAAYVVSDKVLDIDGIKKFIASEKPPYMVPKVISQIDFIPYTQNQKVNKRALPKPEIKVDNIVPPSTDTQKKIFDVVKDIIGTDNFGINTDLYYSGLSSINVVELCVKLSKIFDKPLKNADIIENNTVEKLEAFLLGNGKADETKVEDTFIDIKCDEGEYPITYTQSGIFVECTRKKGSIDYNIPSLLKIPMSVDVSKLVSAINTAFANHPYLFTKIIMKDNGDIRAKRYEPTDCVVMQFVDKLPEAKDLVRSFNIIDNRLFRVEIYFTADDREHYYLFMDLHHIIADGTSISILLDDIEKAYKGVELEKEALDVFELGFEETKIRNSNFYTKAKDYYTKLLGSIEINTLPIKCPDRDNGVGSLLKKGSISVSLVKEFCNKNNVSLNAFVNAAFAYLISRMSYKDEIVYSTIYNGRSDVRLKRAVSMFVKTFPVVYKTKKDEKTIDYIKSIQKQLLDSMSYDVYSFADIKKDFDVNADLMFIFQNDEFNFDYSDKGIENIKVSFDAEKAPISFCLSVEDDKFSYDLSFDKEYFSTNYMNALSDYFEIVVENMLEENDVRKVSLLSSDVKNAIAKVNDTKVPYDVVPVHKLFEKQVELHKDRACYIYDGKVFTYNDINVAANKIANYLLTKNYKTNSIMGLLLNRSENIAIVQYGILKAGFAFTPLIPDYPDDRIDFCLTNADCPVVITTEAIKNERKELFDKSNGKYEVLTVEELLKNDNITNPSIDIPMDSLAYCIYTSGTTGTPKGVLIRHSNITCFCQTSQNARMIKKEDGTPVMTLAMAQITFDGSITEHMVQSCNGNTVVLTKDGDVHNPLTIVKLMNEYKIEYFFATPSLMATFVEIGEFEPALRQMKIYLTAAEAFSKALFTKIKSINNNLIIIDGYGPSECTIGCNERTVLSEDDLNIGKPAANVHLYVFDNDRNQLPFYALGEIVIGGDIVGAGYIKLPEKTKDTFINYNDELVYRCGDVVRQQNDGNFDFFGRIDNLVKLHGFRVELEEIEKVICEYPEVSRSKVIVKNNGKDDYLAAYFTASKDVDLKELTKFMKSKLAYYMVPSAIMQLENFVLNASGKIDKTKLPEIKSEKKEKAKVKKAFVNELCELFKTILNIEDYGPSDDFFEMGGTSLSASMITVKLVNKGFDIDYGDIFDHSTPESLASFIEEKYGAQDTESENTVTNDIKYERYADEKVLDALKYNKMEFTKEFKRTALGDILLTGASGFLGVHILRELIKSEKGHLYITIRKGEFKNPEERLKSVLFYYFGESFDDECMKKITILDLDITDEKLSEKLKDIKLDTIINSAACVKHFANDDILERINVGGVRNLIKIAKEKSAKLIQISTTSIVGIHTDESYNVRLRFHENEHFIVNSEGNKYVLSKYDAETLVFEAISEGLRAKVIRVGNLMGRLSDGEFQINFDTNSFLNGLKAFSILRKSPKTHLTDPMRFSPIDSTARAIVSLSKTNDMFTAFNAENRFSFDEMQLIEACNRNGIIIVPTEDKEFYDMFKEKLGDNEIGSKISILLVNCKEGVHGVDADNEFTGNMLYRLGFSWPILDNEYLDNLVNGLKSLDFFEV